jgi:hypothetical protein
MFPLFILFNAREKIHFVATFNHCRGQKVFLFQLDESNSEAVQIETRESRKKVQNQRKGSGSVETS